MGDEIVSEGREGGSVLALLDVVSALGCAVGATLRAFDATTETDKVSRDFASAKVHIEGSRLDEALEELEEALRGIHPFRGSDLLSSEVRHLLQRIDRLGSDARRLRARLIAPLFAMAPTKDDPGESD